MSRAQQVFPTPDTPPAGGSLPGKPRPLGRVNKKHAMLGAGALGAVLLGIMASRNQPADSDADAAGEAGTSSYELDTRDTDLYNELQPELENISDAILDMNKAPKPKAPTPGTPTPPKPGPKPAPGGSTGTGQRTYVVKKGDTLGEIAKRFKKTRLRLYKVNKNAIENAAKAHGRKSSMQGKWIYPGTRLVIPK